MVNNIEEAREKYRPENINILFVAESPPADVSRFFYYEKVFQHDTLFLDNDEGVIQINPINTSDSVNESQVPEPVQR